MKLLALDISTNTGWAVFDNATLYKYGIITCKDSDISYKEFSVDSMAAMMLAAFTLGKEVAKLVELFRIDEVVIEQTNKGRSRYVQKLLEWFHFYTILTILQTLKKYPYYLDSSKWRSTVGLKLSKDDRKHNAHIRKTGGRGKIGVKHLSVRLVNELYQKSYKQKDNDICDAILLGTAFLKNN